MHTFKEMTMRYYRQASIIACELPSIIAYKNITLEHIKRVTKKFILPQGFRIVFSEWSIFSVGNKV
jgi:hypothetical protein